VGRNEFSYKHAKLRKSHHVQILNPSLKERTLYKSLAHYQLTHCSGEKCRL